MTGLPLWFHPGTPHSCQLILPGYRDDFDALQGLPPIPNFLLTSTPQCPLHILEGPWSLIKIAFLMFPQMWYAGFFPFFLQ